MQTTNISANIALRVPGGSRVAYEADGLIPHLHPGDRLRLMVRPFSPHATCITVDSEKYITLANCDQSGVGQFFSRWIELPAKYEANHLRLVNVTSTGKLTVDEIGIVQQGRNFFLTRQRVYSEQCYRDQHGYVAVPKFSKPFAEKPWRDMVTLVNNLVSNRQLFPYIIQYPGSASSVPASVALSIHQAKVEWYSLAKRLGMARTGTGDQAIILARDVPQNGSRLRYLKSGDTVRFERMVPQDQSCPYRLQDLTLVS